MSASSKKKLRKEEATAKMTDRQLAEQKEAKKLKTYTIAFAVVLVAMLVVAICVGTNQVITSSGIREKNTVALTVGDHEISNVEMNYFYVDAINNFYSTYGSYAALYGLDVTLPLDEQVLDEETGYTWADDFMESAKENIRTVYALADAAEADGYALSEEEKLNIEYTVYNLDAYASAYGYADADAYLQSFYGKGADYDSYLAYCNLTTLADSYYTYYADNLAYDDAALRAAEADNYNAYSSFTYNYYYLDANSFLEGGTTNENGTTSYSDEEKAAAVAAAEEAAKTLTSDEITSVEAFDEAIAALGTGASSTAKKDYAFSYISDDMGQWLADSSRKEGDKTYIASTSVTTAEDGTEVTTTNGYYAMYYISTNDNNFPLANVRHALIPFEGGTADESTGVTTYSDEEKAATMASAQGSLDEWKAGDATEESFIEMVKMLSTDTGSIENGGLYEDIYPGQMVTSFNDWCFDESRQPGDTGVVESEYGCHIMYYVGDSDITYRDYQITNQLRNNDITEWYNSNIEAMTLTEGNTDYVVTDLVINAG